MIAVISARSSKQSEGFGKGRLAGVRVKIFGTTVRELNALKAVNTVRAQAAVVLGGLILVRRISTPRPTTFKGLRGFFQHYEAV